MWQKENKMKYRHMTFKVTRRAPELISAAKPTPKELKYLSPIDQFKGLRLLIPVVQFYKRSEVAQGKDPANVMRKAIGEALVYYYPLAGRLMEVRSGDHKKLAVECNGEGILFTEADANVSIDEFGDVIYPPIFGLSELLFDVPGSAGVLGCPLLLVQVTRLACGGFVMATRFNHAVCDGVGIVQFLTMVSEFARGLSASSTTPVWQRNLISPRDPPKITCRHHEFDQVHVATPLLENEKMIRRRSFIFDNSAVSFLCDRIVQDKRYSTFELIASVIWRARTVSLKLNPSEKVYLICAVESRSKFKPPIPFGYYGNVLAAPAAVTTAGLLLSNPISYSLDLIRNAKSRVNEEYMQSMIDLAVLNDCPPYAKGATLILSDIRRLGVHKVDYGWGKAEFGGMAGWGADLTSVGSFFIPVKSLEGEERFVVTMCLPKAAMDLFAQELHLLMKHLEVRANL